MIEVADLAWMAGVIDLKGRIIVKKNKSRATPQVVLAVQSTEGAVVRRLGELVGTAPEMLKSKPLPDFMRRGCDEHCPERHVHVTPNGTGEMPASARWTVTGVGVAVILTALAPYLRVTRDYEEAIEAITAYMVHQGPGVGMVRKQIQRLKELGWAIPEEIDDLAEPIWPPRLRARRVRTVTAAEVEQMIMDRLVD